MRIPLFGGHGHPPRRAMSADTPPPSEMSKPIAQSTMEGIAQSALPRVLRVSLEMNPKGQLFRADPSRGEHDGDQILTLEGYAASSKAPPSYSAIEHPVGSEKFLNSQIAELAASLGALLKTIPASDRTSAQLTALQAMNELTTEASGKLQRVA